MTKEQAFKEINETQEYYVDQLIDYIFNRDEFLKNLNFTSPTGTGKTKMMSDLCNKLKDYYFVITTLSKGQLNKQVTEAIKKYAKQENYIVYGLCDYTSNTKRTAEDIISLLPKDKEIIWLRDEGHLNTNKWQALLENKCFKIINFSATNKEGCGVKCNFTNTMMLRTVVQNIGTPEEALDKLLQIKKQHKKVKHYNPCAIMRCLDQGITDRVIKACEDRNLKYINITNENYDMSDLCKDDNSYDVILNKFKIVEGIDIRRAHVLYMTNEPKNPATTIQIIGRCRRNALLYRDDIDIFTEENKNLLKNTRQCFVYYNVTSMNIEEDESGELCQAFCDYISCQELKPNSVIEVENGQLSNGLNILELKGESGKYKVITDPETGFSQVKPEGDFYKEEILNVEPLLHGFTKDELDKEAKEEETYFDYSKGEYVKTGKWYIHIKAKNQYEAYTLKKPTKLIYNYDIEEEGTKVIISHNKAVDKMISKSRLCAGFTGYYDTTKEVHNFTSEKRKNEFFKSLKKRKPVSYYIYDKYCRSRIAGNICFLFPDKGAKRILYTGQQKILVRNPVDKYITITQDEYEEFFVNSYVPFTLKYNDKHSAIIGTDVMKSIKTDTGEHLWVEDKAVTSKVRRYSKLNSFVENSYANILTHVASNLFNGKNNFQFDSKCNSCLGYCVEYYSKYLVYGDCYLGSWIKEARKEAKIKDETFINDNLIIRACMLKYRDMMIKAYGASVAKVIKGISITQLIQDNYKEFVKVVIELGTKTAQFIKDNLNITDKNHNPVLSIKHITGLADYISEDTIIDVKCTNSITKDLIKQVLTYHYLSTKRSDLNIKKVIVYDAVSGKSVKIEF